MYKAVNKTKAIWSNIESLLPHIGAPTVHLEENKSFIYVVESKRVTPIVKHIYIRFCSLQKKLTMVFLFKNTRSLLSRWNICAPKHIQVQL